MYHYLSHSRCLGDIERQHHRAFSMHLDGDQIYVDPVYIISVITDNCYGTADLIPMPTLC